MSHEEAIAEAKRRQALDPDASWIATSRDREWTVARIVVRDPPELSHLRRRRTKRRVRGRAVSVQVFGDGRHPVALVDANVAAAMADLGCKRKETRRSSGSRGVVNETMVVCQQTCAEGSWIGKVADWNPAEASDSASAGR